MEALIVIIIIFLFVFLNSLTYILGALATPAGSVFLGTVHWTGDYFYYLSQFAQGASSWFSSYDLYTSDFRNPVLVGWVNMFLGRFFYLIGINHLLAYQLSIVIFAAAFLGVSYLLIREIFRGDEPAFAKASAGKGDRGKRIAAFILFVTSNAFPKIVWEGGKWSFSYFEFWFNTGLPFNRLGGVPHHLVARTAISLALLLGIWWWRTVDRGDKGNKGDKRRWWMIVGISIVGFVLASVEPVHWGLVVLVLFITPILIYGFYTIAASIPNFSDTPALSWFLRTCRVVSSPRRNTVISALSSVFKIGIFGCLKLLHELFIGLLGYFSFLVVFPWFYI